MVSAARKSATYADLCALPDNVVGEIINGELHVSPRPALSHARATGGIFGNLSGPFDRGKDGPGGWLLLIEPELHLGTDIVVPDLAGWRRERMPEMPHEAYATLAPNWVCEVLSPSTARFDRGQKLSVYANAGVDYAWLVDPLAQLLEVLVLDRGGWRIEAVYEGAAVVRASPFDAMELELASLWSR